AGRPHLLERLDDVTLLKLGERAAMELDQVDVIRGEALQAPLDALAQRRRPPLGAPPAIAVPALGEEVVVGPARADRAPDQLLAIVVAFRRVDHVEAGVERRAQQALDRPPAHALVADLRAPEAEHAHVHVRLAEPPALHANLPPRWLRIALTRYLIFRCSSAVTGVRCPSRVLRHGRKGESRHEQAPAPLPHHR